MNKKKQKLLLAVDGSPRALDTVRYVGKVQPFHDKQVVLFHVLVGVPNCYWDLEREPKSVKVVAGVRNWQIQQRKQIDTYMEKARMHLVRSGFSPSDISVKVSNKKKGIARDIITEAGNGYAAVVLRRRGAGALRRIVVGSVANKLIEKLSFVPILIAGQKPPTRRVLIALDGSEGAMGALDFVARTLGGQGYEARLVHVVRGNGRVVATEEDISVPDPCTSTMQQDIEAIFEKATQRLTDAGFEPDKISRRIITGVHSRADAIVKEANLHGYGTIIVGRRGLSNVRDFFIGRVSSKVIQIGRKNTVWVVT